MNNGRTDAYDNAGTVAAHAAGASFAGNPTRANGSASTRRTELVMQRGGDGPPPTLAAAYCGFAQYQPPPPPQQQQQQPYPSHYPHRHDVLLVPPANAEYHPATSGAELRPVGAAGQPPAFATTPASDADAVGNSVPAAPFPWDGIAQQQQQHQFDRNGMGGGEEEGRRSAVGRGGNESVTMTSPKPFVPAASKGGQGSRKRFCLFPGCLKAVKSQGHCQSHGAVAKRCKILGCPRQAQGKHDGMCKRHYKEEQSALAKAQAGESHGDGRQQDGENGNGDAGAASPKKVRTVKSVYDHILPNSIRWNPLRSGPPAAATTPSTATDAAAATTHHPQGGTDHAQHDLDGAAAGEGTAKSATSAAAATAAAAAALGRYDEVMPLVSYLRKGRKKPYGWHRRDERIAMAANPVHVKSQMEPWERRLAIVEILLLSGGTPGADFRDLAHAWGREKGFHHHMTATMCERRGDVERKIRSDRGKDRSSTSERNNKRSLGASASSSGAAIAAAGGTDTMGRPSKRAHRSDGPSPSAVTGMLSAADPDLLGNAAAMAMGGAAL